MLGQKIGTSVVDVFSRSTPPSCIIAKVPFDLKRSVITYVCSKPSSSVSLKDIKM